MSQRPARYDGLRGAHDPMSVDAMMPIKVGDSAGLPEMFDAEGARPVAMH
jgi:hypothetical protein